MSIPNYLTFFRILISPIFLFLYGEYEDLGISFRVLPYILLALLVFAELTDIFDGFLARKYNQVTDLGKLLDPMADSIYRISIFLTFTKPPVELPILLVIIFLYRDSIISTLRTICAFRGFALAARPTGKIKAVIQASSAFFIIILMIPYSLGELSQKGLKWGASGVVALSAGYALFSGIDYLYANRNYILRLLRGEKKADV